MLTLPERPTCPAHPDRRRRLRPTMLTLPERPTCPAHPDRRPVNSRNVGKSKREYVCVVCGRVLGDAPDEGHGEWELQTIGGPPTAPAPVALPPMPEVLVPHPHVTLNADGVPVIKDTIIPVHRLWAWHRQGTATETMLRRYPQLGPARIFDALAFAYDNMLLINASFLRDQAKGG